MTISSEQWTTWISALEVMLQQADLNREHLFGIHLNSAIELAESRLAKIATDPKADQLPSGDAA